MTVSNDVKNDIRVIREAKTLSEAGHEVFIFGNSKNGGTIKFEDGIEIINSKYPLVKKCLLSLKSKMDKYNNDETNNSLNNKQSLKQKIKELLKGLILVSSIEQTQTQILKKIKSTKIVFDSVHCHDLDTLRVGIEYKKTFGSKLIYDSHELWTEMSGINYFVKNRYSKIEKEYFQSIDHVITVSPSIIEEFKKRYNSEIPTTLVRNMPLKSKNANEIILTEPNDNEIKIVYSGFYIKGRGIEFILDSAVKFPDNIKMYLLVQNDPNVIQELKDKVCKLKLEGRVFIKGFVPQEEVIKELSKYDIGILPYLPVSLNNLYCLPNKLFQYLSAGICVVSNNLPDVKDILMTHNCGLTYDETTNLVNVLYDLSENPSKLYKYKKNAKNIIENTLNWDEEKEQLINLYGNLE